MGFISRFVLFWYALAIAVASICVASLCLGVMPHSFVLEQTAFWLARWETVAGAAVVLFLSIYLLGCVFHREAKPEKKTEAVIVRSETGEVSVSVKAVSSMVEKIVANIYGVESVQAGVVSDTPKADGKGKASPLILRLQVGVSEDRNVAAVSDAIRTAVSEHMAKTLGFEDCPIDISVSEIASESTARKPRVS